MQDVSETGRKAPIEKEEIEPIKLSAFASL